jgi:two-component sensor histidine kinase
LIEVSWRLDGGEAGPRLNLEWRERGGPAVAPPGRRGFGSRMIERALAAELRGRVSLDFRPEGVVCEIDAPLASLAAQDARRP